MANSILLGLVQGLTEFLPISSSAHLIYLQKYFPINEPQISFTIFLHFATLIAILLFFRRDVWEILKGFSDMMKGKTNLSTRIIFLLFVGSLPAGILGTYLKNRIEYLFSNIELVSFFLVLTGILLYFGDRIKGANKGILETGIFDVLVIGIAQACAILPGISRSGATIVFGLFCGLERKWAVKYSFFLAVPAILGATILDAPGTLFTVNPARLAFYLAAAATAFFSGYWSLRVVVRFVQKSRLRYFAYYCMVLGLTIIFFQVF